MPLYDFECEFCGKKFEAFDTMDGGVIICPACGSVEDVVRHIGTPGYRTDHTI
jgi:putative FmdB family regulatory protein